MRGFLLDTLDRAIAECDFLVLGGMTGTGKTEVLRRLDDALDLEGHANHRGSSFGKRVSGQPTQINFDNALAIDILRNAPPDTRASWSRTKARPWAAAACRPRCTGHAAPWLVWLEDSLENRKQRILRDYVIDLGAEFVAAHGAEQGQALFAQRLRQSRTTSPGDWAASATAPGGHHGRGAARRRWAWAWLVTWAGSRACCRNTTIPCMSTSASRRPRASCSRGPAAVTQYWRNRPRRRHGDDAPPHPAGRRPGIRRRGPTNAPAARERARCAGCSRRCCPAPAADASPAVPDHDEIGLPHFGFGDDALLHRFLQVFIKHAVHGDAVLAPCRRRAGGSPRRPCAAGPARRHSSHSCLCPGRTRVRRSHGSDAARHA